MNLKNNKKYVLIAIYVFTSFVSQSQILTIPDANFKNALLNTACADFNGDGTSFGQVDLNNDDEIQLSEVLGIQGLRVWNQNITSIEGIESFTDLTYLNVTFNSIVTMDISALTNLTDLWCYGNALTTLDVSNNMNLENLYCNENEITQLDVSQNTSLINLEFYLNAISEIDVTLNLNLETLYGSGNPISELVVANNSMLKELLISETQITEIDVSNNTLLEHLSASNNNMPFIDLSQNTNLLTVYLMNNLLTEIDISNNPDVFELLVQNNDLINANIKNGSTFMVYDSFFGNPDIAFICVDDFEVEQLQTELDGLGYTETVVSDNCELSVDDYNLASKVKLFPLPFKNELFLKSKHEIKNIKIYNISGQKVLDLSSLAMDISVDTEMLSSGFYIIKIETSNGVEVKNIIKQ